MGELQRLIDEEMKDPEFAAAFRRAEQRLAEQRDMWRRGYEQAITHLRDDEAYETWLTAVLDGDVTADANQLAADYLSARLTEETTP